MRLARSRSATGYTASPCSRLTSSSAASHGAASINASAFGIKLGDSSLPQSPVEGGSWIAASVSNGIATTAGAIRDELLRLANQMPNSPLANAAPDDVTLADGKLVSKRDASRSVSIADAMRQGAADRIEREE